VTVIALEKGKDTKDKIYRNFGSSNPEGYRKSLRLMRQAEKFNRPIICFVDTSGAFCGIGAEERGQGQAIAENILEMMALKVPIMSILIGEGGSGGALALATADRVWMLEKAIYSVISPEGCASILWKDTKKVADAADCLKLTAHDMFEFGVVERVIPESSSAGKNANGKGITMSKLKEEICAELKILRGMEESERLEARYRRFRKFGAEV
jgi:acetyl-CoA carboxylase carboxyl transferase subunit alpha